MTTDLWADWRKFCQDHDPECTGCEHDCPWRRHHLGTPFCPVCDDHAEASDDADAEVTA
jgi:hypothetical protein